MTRGVAHVLARASAVCAFALLGLLLDAGLAVSRARAEVKLDVRVDRKSLSLDDVLTLQVSVESRGAAAADVQIPPFDGFEIVRQQVQRPMQFSFSFGSGAVVQSSVIYSFVLRPLRVGQLTIKPITAELEGKRRSSSPVSIAVSAGGSGSAQSPSPSVPDPQASSSVDPNSAAAPTSAAAAANGNVIDLATIDETAFIRAVADNATPYVGEQVTVTMYLYARDRLQATPSVELEPTADGFWIHDLLTAADPPRPQRQMVQGAVFTVYPLRRFAAFPLRSGELTIGPMSMRIDTTSVFDVFGPRRGNPVLSRKGLPLVFQVKPLPERTGTISGEPAVGRFALTAKLDRAQTATGDAVTLSVTVHGQGNVRTVTLPAPVLPGLDVLEPEVKDLVESPDDRVGGTRELRYLIVPREPGRFAIPPFEIAAFDPAANAYVKVASEPLELEVVGRALEPAASANAANPNAGATDGAGEATAPAPISEREWRPIRTESALTRKHSLLVRAPWFFPALALPGVLYAAFLTLRATRRRMQARAQTASSRAEREAREKLQAASAAAKQNDARGFFAAAVSALLIPLEARLGEPATGFTHNELRRHLLARGMDEALAREIVALLERADHQRFGGASTAASLDADLSTLKALRERIATFSPRQAA